MEALFSGGRRVPWDALLVLAVVVSFYTLPLAGRLPPQPNECSRLELSLSLVERGTVAIDQAAEVYGLPVDRSLRDGRHYSDKAPGLAFLGAAVLALGRGVLPRDPVSGWPDYWVVRHVLTWLLAAVPTAVLLAVLWRRYPGESAGEGSRGTAFGLLMALTTPLWTYSTLLVSHAPVAVMCAAAWVLALGPGRDEHVPSPGTAVVSGLLAGYAIATEYPTALVAVVLFATLAWRRSPRRVLLAFAAGCLAGVLPVLVYHQIAFGAPWTTGYALKAHAKHAELHARGLAGIGWPTWERLWGVLLSARRGLLYYCPLLLLVPYGFVVMARRSRRDAVPLVSLTVLYVGFAAGFVDWEAGWSAAARHLTPLVPLLGFPLAEAAAVMARRWWSRLVFVVLTAMSFGNALLSIALDPNFPPLYSHPLSQFVLRSLLSGAAFPNLASQLIGTPARLVVVLTAVAGLVVLAVALVALVPRRGGRWWIPLVLAASLVVHLVALRIAAPEPSPEQEAQRWRTLQALGYERVGH